MPTGSNADAAGSYAAVGCVCCWRQPSWGLLSECVSLGLLYWFASPHLPAKVLMSCKDMLFISGSSGIFEVLLFLQEIYTFDFVLFKQEVLSHLSATCKNKILFSFSIQ